MCCSPDSAALAAAAGPRLDRLRAACADAGMGAFFVRDTSNIAWLTAFDGVFDDEGATKAPGRGAYLCPQTDCLRKAIKSKALDRGLNCQIPQEIYDQLLLRMEAGDHD